MLFQLHSLFGICPFWRVIRDCFDTALPIKDVLTTATVSESRRQRPIDEVGERNVLDVITSSGYHRDVETEKFRCLASTFSVIARVFRPKVFLARLLCR